MPPIIATERLTKTFGTLVAVERLSLEINAGEVFGFLGPNGSGKTTTIRMLLGLIQPTAGRATLFGHDVATDIGRALPRLGAIIETPVFYPYLSGLDNLRVLARASGIAQPRARKRIDESLELVGLRGREGDHYRKYSLGMKQRLGIAASLLGEPELVMLDEPTNGLDPAGVQEIRQLVRLLAERGTTVFLSSHVLHEVQQVCTHVGIMKRGQLVRAGRVRELLAERGRVIVRMANDDDAVRAIAVLECWRADGAGWIDALRLERVDGGHAIVIEAPAARSAEVSERLSRNGLFVAELRRERGNLEELFLDVTSEPAQLPKPAVA